jgi:hypothetical protein
MDYLACFSFQFPVRHLIFNYLIICRSWERNIETSSIANFRKQRVHHHSLAAPPAFALTLQFAYYYYF